MDGFGAVFPILFVVVMVFIVIGFVVSSIAGIGLFGAVGAQIARQNAANDASPILPILNVAAQVASKRIDVWGGESANTSYYVTFEFENRTRKEFSLRGHDYGMLAEGDQGILQYQGTRFLGFSRDLSEHDSHTAERSV